MAKKSNYWYVLVMTNEGPKFVTEVNYMDKTAKWDKLEKPLEMSKQSAQDLAVGLCLNFNMAYAVCQPFEIDSQPYIYSKGHLEWKESEKDE